MALLHSIQHQHLCAEMAYHVSCSIPVMLMSSCNFGSAAMLASMTGQTY